MRSELDLRPGPDRIDEGIIADLDLHGDIAELMRLKINEPYLNSAEKFEIEALSESVGTNTTEEVEDMVEFGKGPFGRRFDKRDYEVMKDRLQHAQELDHGELGFVENGNLELQL